MATSAPSASTSKAVDDGPGMEYDLDGSFPPFGSEAFDQIKDLYSLNQYRAKSEAWAFKDIKILIFDDSDETQQPQEPPSTPGSGYDSDDEDSTLTYAMKLSMESAEMGNKQPDAGSSHDYDGELGLKRTATEAGPSTAANQRHLGKQPEIKDYRPTPCKVCSALPEFPHDRKPRRLRLFRPDVMQQQSSTCIHYVSLSYCWPSRPKDSKGNLVPVEGSYEIRELDGSIRRNRILDEVLDRAVDFAQTCGLRMIWVDQESLPQADEDDREIALQAMDIVYNRAIITAGLHSVPITTLNHIGAIENLIRVFGPPYQQGSIHDVFLPGVIPPVLDFLNSVAKDRWYQRAWIAQESISASGKLHLVFPLAPDLSLMGLLNQKHRFIAALRTPPHSLDHTNRQFPAIQWSISEKQFENLVQGIKRLYDGVVDQCIVDSSVLLALKPHAVTILRAAVALRPIRLKRQFIPSVMGGASYGRRQKINAAGAFTIFRTRVCSRPHDRIAIMANMCAYDIRLDTRAVKERGGSLRIALLALATMNGDLSLFVPEIYRSLPDHIGNYRTPGTTLLQPFNASAHLIHYDIAEHGGLIRHKPTAHLRAHDVRRPGLNFPSYIWKVEDELDLRILSPAFVQRNNWAQIQLAQILFSILRHSTTSLYLGIRWLREWQIASGIRSDVVIMGSHLFPTTWDQTYLIIH